MIKKAEILTTVFIVLNLCPINLRAEVVTIYLTAEAIYLEDPYNALEGKITIGDTITGSYSYDSDTPDTNPLDTVGDYWHYTPPMV